MPRLPSPMPRRLWQPTPRSACTWWPKRALPQQAQAWGHPALAGRHCVALAAAAAGAGTGAGKGAGVLLRLIEIPGMPPRPTRFHHR